MLLGSDFVELVDQPGDAAIAGPAVEVGRQGRGPRPRQAAIEVGQQLPDRGAEGLGQPSVEVLKVSPLRPRLAVVAGREALQAMVELEPGRLFGRHPLAGGAGRGGSLRDGREHETKKGDGEAQSRVVHVDDIPCKIAVGHDWRLRLSRRARVLPSGHGIGRPADAHHPGHRAVAKHHLDAG